MKRPVGFCCIAILAILLFSAFLPRAVFWLPAAFSLAAGVLLWRKGSRWPGGCLGAAALISLLICGKTLLLNQMPAERWIGKQVVLDTVVVSASESYIDSMSSAVLQVNAADGLRVDFRVSCACLPECEAGERVRAVFQPEALAADGWRLQNYADGVFLRAEYVSDFSVSEAPLGLRMWFRKLQYRIAWSLRYMLSDETGGVFAAMVTGDRRYLDKDVYATYQAAGIAHVLVVSGLHLTVLCSLLPLEMRYRKSRLLYGIGTILLALFFIGLTGGSPSVWRAGIAVLINSTGILLGLPADPITSLATAGLLMSVGNSYAVFDVSFQLSFAATAGVLAGAEWWHTHRQTQKTLTGPKKWTETFAQTGLIAFMAALATIPVLALWGMSISLVSIPANMAIFLLINPILYIGLLAAAISYVPVLSACVPILRLCGGVLVGVLNTIADWFSRLPGVRFCPENGYPALVVGVLVLFVALAKYWNYSDRCIAAAAAALFVAAMGTYHILTRDLIKVAMVGNAASPAVVITQHNKAAVLYRGSYANALEVTQYLERRNIHEIELLVDLRMRAGRACPLSGRQNLSLAADGKTEPDQNYVFEDMDLVLVKEGQGGIVFMLYRDYTIWVASGTLPDMLPADNMDLLLASSGNPNVLLHCDAVLTLSENHKWLADYKGKVYSGTSGAAVWLRPKNKVQAADRITGASL